MGSKYCKNENVDGKYLENMVKSSLIELEKDLTKLEDRELKDKKKKPKRRWKNYFITPIIRR